MIDITQAIHGVIILGFICITAQMLISTKYNRQPKRSLKETIKMLLIKIAHDYSLNRAGWQFLWFAMLTIPTSILCKSFELFKSDIGFIELGILSIVLLLYLIGSILIFSTDIK